MIEHNMKDIELLIRFLLIIKAIISINILKSKDLMLR